MKPAYGHFWGLWVQSMEPMATSEACECGAEEQTVDHVVLHVQTIDLSMDCTAWRF